MIDNCKTLRCREIQTAVWFMLPGGANPGRNTTITTLMPNVQPAEGVWRLAADYTLQPFDQHHGNDTLHCEPSDVDECREIFDADCT